MNTKEDIQEDVMDDIDEIIGLLLRKQQGKFSTLTQCEVHISKKINAPYYFVKNARQGRAKNIPTHLYFNIKELLANLHNSNHSRRI